MKIFQTKNKRINAYVKYQKTPSGKVRIINVKQQEPEKPFKGVPIKKK